jgi:hypothetical protein
MLQLKPQLDHNSTCPHCAAALDPVDTLWMGMHVLVKSNCAACHAEIIEDLKIGHSLYHESNQIDLKQGIVFGRGLGSPDLIESLPANRKLKNEIDREIFKEFKRVIVLNCLDYLYGHCLLKLLNAQRYLEDFPEYGLIAIVPKFLRWLVPEGVAEIWTIDIPLKNSLLCYPEIDRFVRREFDRFDEIYVSKAYSHPIKFDITKFTNIYKHDFDRQDYRISFIWREDRPWCSNLLVRILRKTNLMILAAILQNWKIHRLFSRLRLRFPSARFTVIGLGSATNFPNWIEDCRIKKFDAETERQACQIYADSRLLFGVHGSNMLLPSAHAGMTIDLMSIDRLGNIAQDILYQETNPRMASVRYRYLPIATNPAQLFELAESMLLCYHEIFSLFEGEPIARNNHS